MILLKRFRTHVGKKIILKRVRSVIRFIEIKVFCLSNINIWHVGEKIILKRVGSVIRFFEIKVFRLSKNRIYVCRHVSFSTCKQVNRFALLTFDFGIRKLKLCIPISKTFLILDDRILICFAGNSNWLLFEYIWRSCALRR
ncbi:hypothetical protein Hanom_Chr12g01159051 [Helianthus anomalus]